MNSTTPLEIPEIMLMVAALMDKPDITRCVRVARSWHYMFIPLLWKVTRAGRIFESTAWRGGSSFRALTRHRHFITSLEVKDDLVGFYAIEFPSLRSMILHLSGRAPQKELRRDPARILACNKTLVKLDIRSCWPNAPLSEELWMAIEGLSYLTSLRLTSTTISTVGSRYLWRICYRLESLALVSTFFQASSSPPTETFPRMRKLFFPNDYEENLDYFDLISNCPELEELDWTSLCFHEPHDKNRFLKIISNKSWPKLECLSLWCAEDRDLAKILNGMEQVTKLEFPFANFGPLSFEALRRHFGTVKILKLSESGTVTGKMVREILCSCPRLEELEALFGSVVAGDVKKDGPWVCLSLRTLRVEFEYEPEDKTTRAMIHERLQGLSQLEFLEPDWGI